MAVNGFKLIFSLANGRNWGNYREGTLTDLTDTKNHEALVFWLGSCTESGVFVVFRTPSNRWLLRWGYVLFCKPSEQQIELLKRSNDAVSSVMYWILWDLASVMKERWWLHSENLVILSEDVLGKRGKGPRKKWWLRSMIEIWHLQGVNHGKVIFIWQRSDRR